MDEPLHITLYLVWSLAAGMWPVAFLFASCSNCCQSCSKCNYFEHTESNLDNVDILAGSFTLTHPGLAASVSATVQPNTWTRARIVAGGPFAPSSDIKDFFMSGCLSSVLQGWLNSGLTEDQFKNDLNIGIVQLDPRNFGHEGSGQSDQKACDSHDALIQVVVAMTFVDHFRYVVLQKYTTLGVCPNENSVTVNLNSIDNVFLWSSYGESLGACEQQLLDFCNALTIAGSFTHTGCFCGPCCEYEEWGSLKSCEDNVAEGACQDYQFRYFPPGVNCDEADCPDYREFA